MKDKIIEKIDKAIGMLDTIRIDIALKPKRESIDDQASDLNLLLCKIHDEVDSLYSAGVSGKEFKILRQQPEGFRIDYIPSEFLPKTRGVLMLHPDLIPEPPKEINNE